MSTSRTPVVIQSPNPDPGSAVDFRALRTLGLETIIRTGSDFWTDYNEHDPGITILEVLTFALTDLGYRTGFPIEDILAQPRGASEESLDRQFYTCRDILTTEPVTFADLRKQIIDPIEVQNAWVARWKNRMNPIHGLVSILADPERRFWGPLRLLDSLNRLSASDLLGPVGRAVADWEKAETHLDGAEFPASVVEAWLMVWGLPSTHGRELSDILSSAAHSALSWMNEFMAPLKSLPGAFPQMGEDARTRFVAQSVSNLLQCPHVSESAWKPAGLRPLLETIASAGAIQQRLVEGIRQTYRQHRPLGQDLASVTLRRPVCVSFSIVWAPTAGSDPSRTVAKILRVFESFLTRAARFRPLEAATQACGGDRNRVYDGPALSHGFLTNASLEDPPSRFKGSDVALAVSELPEVAHVQKVRIAVSRCGIPETQPRWMDEVSFPVDVRPELATLEAHDLRPAADLPRVRNALENLRHQEGAAKLAPGTRDISIPSGRFRDLLNYSTVQRDFPRLYGLEPNAVSTLQGTARLAQARQLKAYLLIFDQILGNYLAQLSHLGALFSWSPDVRRSRFFRGLEDALEGFAELIETFPLPLPDDPSGKRAALAQASESYRRKLGQLREDPASFEARRNAFLDHMLSRFGRGLDDYVLNLRRNPDETASTGRIRIKQRILQRYGELSAGRGGGEYRSDETGSADHPSGLRDWLSVVLDLNPGFPDSRDFVRRFVEAPGDDPTETRPITSRFIVRTSDGAPVDMAELTRLGSVEDNFGVQPPVHPDDGYRVILNPGSPPQRPARSYELSTRYPTGSDALAAKREVAEFLRTYDRASEHLELIEHVLLRPGNLEEAYGLRLLDATGTPWIETKRWSSLDALSVQFPHPVSAGVIYSIQEASSTVLRRLMPGQDALPQTITPDDLRPNEGVSFRFSVIETPGTPNSTWSVGLKIGSTASPLLLESLTSVASQGDADVAIDRWMRSCVQSIHTADRPWQTFCRPAPQGMESILPSSVAQDPYSFVASLVIPNWPSRFQTDRFKSDLARTIATECPTHVWIHPVWLDHRRYQVFNGLFGAWKQASGDVGITRDRAAAALLRFLLTMGLKV